MSESMVERVADAVIEKLEECGDSDISAGVGRILGLGDAIEMKEFRATIGRAAIAAMREPTAAMVSAADDVKVSGADLYDFAAYDCAPAVWRAMIDAALKDGG